jgi:hypothetical protein
VLYIQTTSRRDSWHGKENLLNEALLTMTIRS